jgi:hypothetical protein
MKQCWRATWIDRKGQAKVCIFRSTPVLMQARLDFQLRLLDQGERVPEHFELEERHLPPLRPIRLLKIDHPLVETRILPRILPSSHLWL